MLDKFSFVLFPLLNETGREKVKVQITRDARIGYTTLVFIDRVEAKVSVKSRNQFLPPVSVLMRGWTHGMRGV
jgi:hypothetical protein